MVIRRIGSNILTCSTPFLRFGRIKIGGRGTIVKLKDDSLAVFSPVALTATVKQKMEEELQSTNVKYITALDAEHHIFLESWHKEWPEAKVIMPDTLPAYREKQGYFKIPDANVKLFKKGDESSLNIDETFDAEFDREYVHAHANKELVFNHKSSKTLIEADFLFNLPATEQFSKAGISPTSGFLTKLFVSLNGTAGEATWQRRLIWYGISSGDRTGFNTSVTRIAKWDFDRIIPCHGDVIESGGKGIFEKVMKWHLDAAKKAN
jgi:hypothetical protein